jgi:hypothetical protein
VQRFDAGTDFLVDGQSHSDLAGSLLISGQRLGRPVALNTSETSEVTWLSDFYLYSIRLGGRAQSLGSEG